jgi:hypothetical protein
VKNVFFTLLPYHVSLLLLKKKKPTKT